MRSHLKKFNIPGRLVTGHAGGSNLVSSPIFVSEISHPDIRGTSSVLTMVLCTSGFFIGMLAGAALNWRLASGLFVITGVLSFILLLFCKVRVLVIIDKSGIILFFMAASFNPILVQQAFLTLF